MNAGRVLVGSAALMLAAAAPVLVSRGAGPAGPGPRGEATASAPAAAADQGPGAAAASWRPFDGSWSASGQRQTIPTEHGRAAAIVRLSGSVVLGTGEGLGRGFRGEFIGFDDGGTVSVGRWVWTDSGGNQVFGEVKGEPVRTGGRFVATITGGSGRYAGIVGDYEFTWQSVVEADGSVHGRTSALKGRYRQQGVRP